MATMMIRTLTGLALGFATASVFAQDVSQLLDATIELQRRLESDTARSERAAQSFGASLSAAERRELQSACTALASNANDAAARQRLEVMRSRYRDNSTEAIMRFCLEPTISRLRTDLRASRQTLERLNAAGLDTEATADLRSTHQKQRQLEQMISNSMKADNDPKN